MLQHLPTSPCTGGCPGNGQGLGLTPLLCPTGKRWSTACAYLHPVLSRPNLIAEARTLVSRVLFEGTRAVGVEYVKNGQSHRVSKYLPGRAAHGRKEVDSEPGGARCGQESCSHPHSIVMRCEQLVAMA